MWEHEIMTKKALKVHLWASITSKFSSVLCPNVIGIKPVATFFLYLFGNRL